MSTSSTRVLVAVASRYGATAEIGSEIGAALAEHGCQVTVADIETLPSVQEHDVVVLGSALYAGHWLKHAREFVDANRDTLKARRVWLFSSGPIGEPPQPADDPADLPELIEKTGALGHRLFSGKVDRSQLRFAERAILAALRVPDGDFRDFGEARTWAVSLVDEAGDLAAAGETA